MIGAIPKTGFQVSRVDLAGAVGLLEPVAVHAVDEMGFDEIPDLADGDGEAGVAGQLSGVDESDQGLGLRPPRFAVVVNPSGAAFIEQAAVRIAAFAIDRFGQG